MINKVLLLGNLGQDPKVRTTESGKKVANFSLATSESYKDKHSGERKQNTEWHNVVCWEGTANLVEQFLKKGSKVYLEGKIRSRSYEDQSGTTKYITEILANQIVFLDSKTEKPAPAMVS